MKKNPKLYIIAGANGAGKTTTAFKILPEILECKEFVNADLIANALSPFNSESVAIESGRIMIKRINTLIDDKINFAFETTLSARSFIKILHEAKKNNFRIIIIFLWIHDYKIAYERVKSRVKEGGHNVPQDIIKRRYFRGIFNFINVYLDISDYAIAIDNSGSNPEIIAEIRKENNHTLKEIYKQNKWNKILSHAKKDK